MKNEEGVHDLNFSEWSAILAWMAGIVIANSGWSTFFAIVFPPWAWYLLVQQLFILWGVV